MLHHLKKLIFIPYFISLSFLLSAQGNLNSRVNSTKADLDQETLNGYVLIDVFSCDSKSGTNEGIAVRAIKSLDSDTYDLYLYDRYVGISNDKVLIDKFNQQAFLEAMDSVRCKFVEWSSVAKENKITDFHKKIPFSKEVVVSEYITSSFRPVASWMEAYFDVNDKGKASVSIYFTHEHKREYYSDYDFYSLEKLDHFIYIIQPEYVLKVIEQTQKRIDEMKTAEKEREALFK